MKTVFAASVLTFMLTGCGWFDRYVVANTTGYARLCVDKVSYLQFPSGVSVQYDADGKIVTCK